MAGNVYIQVSGLMEFVSESLTKERIEKLTTRAQSSPFMSPEELKEYGLNATYDPGNLLIKITLAADSRAEKTINLQEYGRSQARKVHHPENFATGMDISFRRRAIHEQDGDDPEDLFTPITGSARGFLRFKKVKPIYISYEYDLEEGEGWHRVQTTAFYDDKKKAIRYAAGDLTPRNIGFQESLAIGGVAIERQYREIQPFRRTLPGGRSQLVLDQRSRVDVIINNIRARTITLNPGKYDIRDFPLVDGINNVTLEIEGANGEKKTLDYDFFSDAQLLNTELLEFSLAAGSIRRRDDRVVRYDGTAVFSGFAEKGLNNKTTLATYTQLAKEDFLAGLRLARATEAGLFGLDAAYGGDSFHSGHALRLSYKWWDIGEKEDFSDKEFDLVFEILGEDYKSFLADDPASGEDWRLEGRFRTKLPYDFSGSIGASHTDGRGTTQHTQRASFVLSRLFKRIQASLSGDVTRAGNKFEDGQLFLSLSMPLGEQQTLRFTTNTDQNATSAEWSKRVANGANQWGARIEYERNDDQQQANGQFDYIGNRFTADIDHDVVHDFDTDNVTRETDLRIRTAWGYTGGKFAIGRSALPGFMITETHENLGNLALKVQRGGDAEGFGFTDAFGPILVPVDRKYNVRHFDFEMDELPVGYNPGPASITLMPGAFTGYKYTYGSAASITLMGRLHDKDDAPLKLTTGTLQRSDDDTAEAIPFFTNRTGRMVADAISSGTYTMYINDEAVAEITVPDDKVGLYDIGKIIVE